MYLYYFFLDCAESLLLHMGYSLAVVCRLLLVVASLVAEQGL